MGDNGRQFPQYQEHPADAARHAYSRGTGLEVMEGRMIKQLSGQPAGVIGFEVTGKVTAEDFRDVVLPAVDNAARSGDVRFVIVIPEFHGMTPAALWEDLKVASETFRKWKRIAVITDVEWMHHMTALFGWMTPGDMKTFPTIEREQGMAWVSA